MPRILSTNSPVVIERLTFSAKVGSSMLCWVNNNKNVLIQWLELSSSNILDFDNSVIDNDNQNTSVLNIATVI